MSVEIEFRILGSLMLIGNYNDIKAQESFLKLRDVYFFDRNAKIIFKLMLKLYQSHEWFDFGMLSSLVDAEQFECIEYIANSNWSAASLQKDIQYLVDCYQSQCVEKEIKTLIHDFKNEPVPALACELAMKRCIEIANMSTGQQNKLYTTERYLDEFLTNQFVKKRLIPSGIKVIDDFLDGGFKENCLITIAGRSGMGKTGFGVHLAHNLAKNHPNRHVLFFSLEMSAADIYEKQIISIMKKRTENNTLPQFVINEMMATKFTILEEPLASIKLIETTSRITAIKNPLSVIVVDYLSIVQNDSKFESNALKQADIAMRLAALAKELNCIVIALTQVNRDHAERKDKHPITSDAADSSGSERSSTYWFGIYRPKVDEDSLPDEFYVSCRKNRFGKTWRAVFAFEQATFREIPQTWGAQTSEKGFKAYKEQKGW